MYKVSIRNIQLSDARDLWFPKNFQRLDMKNAMGYVLAYFSGISEL